MATGGSCAAACPEGKRADHDADLYPAALAVGRLGIGYRVPTPTWWKSVNPPGPCRDGARCPKPDCIFHHPDYAFGADFLPLPPKKMHPPTVERVGGSDLYKRKLPSKTFDARDRVSLERHGRKCKPAALQQARQAACPPPQHRPLPLWAAVTLAVAVLTGALCGDAAAPEDRALAPISMVHVSLIPSASVSGVQASRRAAPAWS